MNYHLYLAMQVIWDDPSLVRDGWSKKLSAPWSMCVGGSLSGGTTCPFVKAFDKHIIYRGLHIIGKSSTD